jgi:phage I-like protein
MDTFKTAAHATAIVPKNGAVPEWIQLLPAGEFSGRDGRGPYKTDAAAILDWFAKWGERVIDYEHPEERRGQPVPGAGWIKEMQARGDGVWGRVEWTARAAKMIADKEYRYLSPVFDYEPATGRVARIASAGLTNQPNLFLTAFNRQNPSGDDDMEEFLQRARQLFGAKEMTKEAALAEMDALIAAATAPEMRTARQALGLSEAASLVELVKAAQSVRSSAEPSPAAGAELKTQLATALQRILTLEQGLAQKEVGDAVDKLVAEARAAQKITPANEARFRELAKLNIEAARGYLDATPALALSSSAHTRDKPSCEGDKNPLIADALRRSAPRQGSRE